MGVDVLWPNKNIPLKFVKLKPLWAFYHKIFCGPLFNFLLLFIHVIILIDTKIQKKNIVKQTN